METYRYLFHDKIKKGDIIDIPSRFITFFKFVMFLNMIRDTALHFQFNFIVPLMDVNYNNPLDRIARECNYLKTLICSIHGIYI